MSDDDRRTDARSRRPDPQAQRVSRRTLFKGGLAIGAGAVGLGLSSPAGASIERALAIDAVSTNPTLSDIRHVVILMQENRSFDHYFGTLSGVRGFSDSDIVHNVINGASRPVWEQFGYSPIVGPNPNGWLLPFHLLQNPPENDGDTTNDIDHSWGTQHASWNGGKMDAFVTAHMAADGVDNFAATMGYFQRSDLSFYYALADAFTICDAYHCSVLGPTDPNRVMSLSGTIDPAGDAGGPVLVTQTEDRPEYYGTLDWTTMPEQLLDAGVTWKVYNDPTGLALFNPLPYFEAYNEPTTTRGQQLIAGAIAPNYPADFAADVAAGTLPQVSWIHGPAVQCEHPATAPQWGENLVQTVLDTLTSNPEVWAHTLFILNYDENGGFFDHVPPPVAPAGHGRRIPDDEPAALQRRRHRRAGGPRLPGPLHPHVALHPRWLPGDGCVRPHLDPAPHGDALRRRGAQPVGLAARRHRRHDECPGPRATAGHDRAVAAGRSAGRAHRRRADHPELDHRHLRLRRSLPTAVENTMPAQETTPSRPTPPQ